MDFNSGKEGHPVVPENGSVSEMHESPGDPVMGSMLSDEGHPVSNPTPNAVANPNMDTIVQSAVQMGTSDMVRQLTLPPDMKMSVSTVTQATTESSVSVVNHYNGPVTVYKDITAGENAHIGNVFPTAQPASSGDHQEGLPAVTNSPTQKDANMKSSLSCLEDKIKQCFKDELYETRKEIRKLKTDHKTSHCEIKDYLKQLVSHLPEDPNRVQQILGDMQQKLKQNEDENRDTLTYIATTANANNIRLDDLSKRTGQMHATTKAMIESQKKMEAHRNMIQATDRKLMKEVKESQKKLESDVQHTQNQSLQNKQMILDHSQSTDEKITQIGETLEKVKISTSKNTDETYRAAALASSANAKVDVMHEQVAKNEQASKAQEDKIAVLEEKVAFNDPDPRGFKTPFFREKGDLLIDHVKADGLLIKMFSSEALTVREMSAIKKEGSPYDKVARLLAILDKKADGVDLLLQGLRDDGQDELVAEVGLLQEIRDDGQDELVSDIGLLQEMRDDGQDELVAEVDLLQEIRDDGQDELVAEVGLLQEIRDDGQD